MRWPWCPDPGPLFACLTALSVCRLLASCADDGATGSPPEAADAAPEPDAAERDSSREPDSADDEPDSADDETDAGLVTEVDPPADPCLDIPAGGRCANASTLELCVVSGETRTAERLVCMATEHCKEQEGRSACVPNGSCSEHGTRCADAETLQTCVDGVYRSSGCVAGCVQGPLAAFCPPDLDTMTFTGHVRYAVRRSNASRSDWSATTEWAAGPGVAVLSYRGEELIDATSASLDPGTRGEFSLRVPAERSDDDALVVLAAGAGSEPEIAYAVADPGFPAGATLHSPLEEPPEPRLWSWRYPLSTLAPGAALSITEEAGAGAVHTFAAMQQVFALGQSFYEPAQPQKILGWFGLGTIWTCGACYAGRPTMQFETRFQHQLRVDGSSDQEYWSDSVTYHELGHYVMSAFGFPPREVGPRYIGTPTNPGLAWIEGWATFFSAMQRDDPVFVDKQDGVFFWWDLELRRYSDDDPPWQRPVAAAGLMQPMDENDVAALLWASFQQIGESGPLLSALASERMRVAPFERGYTRRSWSDPDALEDSQDTGESHPMLADFLDALRCADALSTAQLAAITQPSVYYPYSGEDALCR